MKSFMTFLLFIFIFHHAVRGTENQLAPFQKNIKLCFKNQIEIKKIKNLNQLYESLNKKFALRTTETIYREVLFKQKSQIKKLKLENGKIALYKVMPDETIVLENNDARQKGLTEESAMNQLLASSDVQSDWFKVKETRSDRTTLVYYRQDGQLKTLSFESARRLKHQIFVCAARKRTCQGFFSVFILIR